MAEPQRFVSYYYISESRLRGSLTATYTIRYGAGLSQVTVVKLTKTVEYKGSSFTHSWHTGSEVREVLFTGQEFPSLDLQTRLSHTSNVLSIQLLALESEMAFEKLEHSMRVAHEAYLAEYGDEGPRTVWAREANRICVEAMRELTPDTHPDRSEEES